MFSARNPRWWLKAAGAAGVCALTAVLVANAPARNGQSRPSAQYGGADPRLDALALAIAFAASAAVLVALRRPGSRDADAQTPASRAAVSPDADL
ncbi:hypothetical protein [Streptomyces lasiicapitis]|uniref:hypothetical protein n=1 Tax=Streptomyces lasiicapitis TaxID=1923961 RepID=UPI0036545810